MILIVSSLSLVSAHMNRIRRDKIIIYNNNKKYSNNNDSKEIYNIIVIPALI